MRACSGSGSVGARVSFFRISRQRAAWRLQQRQVLGELAPRRGVPRQLLGDHGDGRERRAELVRRGGGEPVEGVQLLLRASTISVAASASAICRDSLASRQA